MEQKKYPEFPVLVVDDDNNFLNSIEYVLRSRGISNVERCDNSFAVMPCLEKKKYSVILLDLMMEMGGIPGEELLVHIVKEYPEIPVISLTGLNMVEIAVKCIKQGAIDYLVKPPDSDKLIKTIQMVLELKSAKKMVKVETNPYIYGSYITDLKKFYGRRDLLTKIIQKIENKGNDQFRGVYVVGDYRIGKSSLLKKIEYEIESKTNLISVYIDLSGLSQQTFTKSIIGRILSNTDKKLGEKFYEKIKKSLKNRTPNKIKSIDMDIPIIGSYTIIFNPQEENHWDIFFNDLTMLTEKIKKRGYQGIVLILDEISSINEWANYKEILDNLRARFQELKGIYLLIGSSHQLYYHMDDFWYRFFNILDRQNLKQLNDDEANELIKLPAANEGLHYSGEAVKLIKRLCGNKPYYIQVLCSKIFENLRKEISVPDNIDSSIVEVSIEDTLVQLCDHLDKMFEKYTEYQRSLLLSIANRDERKTQILLSDEKKKFERDMLRGRVLIYRVGKEYKIDGLMERWLLKDY